VGAYIDSVDLEHALSPTTVAAIFDDDGDGVADPAPIAAVIDRAEAMVDSFVVTEQPVPVRGRDRLLRHAALEFAIAFSFERHPEYVRTFGEAERANRWQRGIELMERIANAVQMLPDVKRKPANVGGIVYDRARRVVVDDADGTANAGDF
jgi:hypothetical protein